MKVIGLDLSLTATGVAHADGHSETLGTGHRGVQRLAWFADQVTDLVDAEQPDLVVLEDYAYSARNAHSHELGELGGVVRLALHDRHVRWLAVIPSTLKKYATGKGNAPKELMLAEAVRRLGYAGHSNDEADALWLQAMALDGLGRPLVAMPADNRKALNKVPWPIELGGPATVATTRLPLSMRNARAV